MSAALAPHVIASAWDLQEGGAQGCGLAISRPQLFLLELVHSGEEHTGRDLGLVVQQIFRQSFLPSTELEIFTKSLQASSNACQEPVPDTVSWLPLCCPCMPNLTSLWPSLC